jgi:hypothetical protein
MVHENGREEGLLLRVEPLEMAKWVCERMVERVREVDGALELDVDPSYGAAIITVLAKKGMRGAICVPSDGVG